MANSNPLAIYDPVTNPIKGLASYRGFPQIPIGTGFFKNLQNVRWGDTGVVSVRNGSTLIAGGPVDITDSGLSSGSNTSNTLHGVVTTVNKYAGLFATCDGQERYIVSNTTTVLIVFPDWTSIPAIGAPFSISSIPKGFATLTFGGDTGYIAAAFKSPALGRTRVHFGNSPTALAAATITGSSGKYGNTNIESDSSGNDYGCVFAVVNDRFSQKDCLIIQNGYAPPRVYDGTDCAIHLPITPPTRGNNWYNSPGPSDALPMATGAPTTWNVPAHSTVGWDLVESGGGGLLWYANLLITATTLTGTAGVTFVTPLTVGQIVSGVVVRACKQIILTLTGTAQSIDAFRSTFKVEVAGTQSSSDLTLYDPSSTNGTDGLTTIGPNPNGGLSVWHLCYAVDPLIAANVDYQFSNMTFTPVANAPSSPLDVGVYGICAGGLIPAATQIAVSYYNSGSRAESYEQVLPIRPAALNDNDGAALGSYTWPVDDRIYLEENIWVAPIDQAQAVTGVDTLRIYGMLTGENVFTLFPANATLAVYSTGTWTPTAPTNPGTGLVEFTLDQDPNQRLLWLTSPGAFIEPIPISRAMAVGTGSRLIVGARSDNLDAFPRVALSASSMPFRFVSVPDLTDPTTGYEDSLNSENVQAFVSSAASTFAAATIYCFTDKSVWIVDPVSIGTAYYLRRVSTIGTVSPESLVENRGHMFFLDTNNQISVIAGASDQPLSRGWINDKLASIPVARLRSTPGLWFNFRYYMGRTVPGGLWNTNMTVYSENAQAWESDDLAPPIGVAGEGMSFEGLIAWQPNTTAQTGAYGVIAPAIILALGIDCNLYQYETGSTDLGNDISIQMLTGALSRWGGLTIKRIGVLMDGVAGKVLNFTRTFWPSGATASSVLDTSNTNPFDWSWDQTPQGITEPSIGSAAYIDMTSDLPGGTTLWGWDCEPDGRTTAPRGQG